MLFTHEGYAIVGDFGSGAKLLTAVAQLKPHIVCLDVDKPVMSGLEALNIIHVQSPATKVLMITANTNRETFAQAAKSGATGYILKPYQPDKVVQAITQLLETL